MRVIGQNRSYTNQYGVACSAHLKNALARHFAGDGRLLTSREAGLAVRRNSELEHYIGPPTRDAADVTGMRALRLIRAKPYFDGNPFFAQPLVAFPRHLRVRIFHRRNDARDTRTHNRIGARRGLSLV